MPTGYTAPIADGMTFEQFALGCARAFGALVTMRDEPSDAPIPERLEPDTPFVAAPITASLIPVPRPGGNGTGSGPALRVLAKQKCRR
jgi:hypothetical protein